MFFGFMKIDELVKILSLTAKKWELVLNENTIKIENNYGITKEGYILENDNGKLNSIQKVSCNVLENKIGIIFMKIIHDGGCGTLIVQAFEHNSKPLPEYYYESHTSMKGNEIINEVQNYLDNILNS